MRRLVRIHRQSLKGGLYFINGRLAYRSGYAPPKALIRKKATSRLAAPALLRRGALGPSGYECLSGAVGGVLLFGGDSNTVKRIISQPLFDAEYEALRERFSRHLSTPAFKVDASRRSQVEQEVHGVFIDELDEAHQVGIARHLLHKLASLGYGEPQGDSGQFVQQALARLNPSLLPAELARWLPTVESSNLVAKGPLVPSHGDFGTHNLIYDNRDFWVIDWDPRYAGLKPFWYDPMSLFQDSDVLRRSFVRGDFDAEFADLYSTVGLPADLEQIRQLLPIAWVATFLKQQDKLDSMAHHRTITRHFNMWSASIRAR